MGSSATRVDGHTVRETQRVVLERMLTRLRSLSYFDYTAHEDRVRDLEATLNIVRELFDELNGRFEDKTVVSVYATTRHYGGPEEGGWWYDWYELVETRRVDGPADEEEARRELRAKYDPEQPEYPISSVLGDEPEFQILGEDYVGQWQSFAAPRYE